jgi:hypothetical protein
MLFTDPELVTRFEAELAEVRSRINEMESRQAFLVNKLERAGVARRDGARTMGEWVATRLDVSAGTATRLVKAANVLPRHRWLWELVAAGSMTLERALATVELAGSDAPDGVVERSLELDLPSVGRLTHRYRRVRSTDEREIFAERYLVMQPSLDRSRWRGWFELPGVDGSIVDEAISRRADEFRALPGGDCFGRRQRQGDALVAMAADSLDRNVDNAPDSGGAGVVVFVDLDAANGNAGELGATVEYGPRVGPNTLTELVCSGSVQLIGLEAGRPVVASNNTRAIPPVMRRFVSWRDGGCSVAGCHSRYRLQPHHIQPRAGGGDHHPDNLTTLCWFHHHVAVHGAGFDLRDGDPPGCRRLVAPNPDRGPPI